jgi:hypothetical protein
MFHLLLLRNRATERPPRTQPIVFLLLFSLLGFGLAGPVRAQSQRYEAEDPQVAQPLGGASIGNVHSNYSGSGFVEHLTTTGAAVRFTVPAQVAGRYYVTLRYAASSNDRNLNVYVNGSLAGPTQLRATPSWSHWASKTELLTLRADTNTIEYRFDSNNSGWVNLDYIWLSKFSGNGALAQPIRLGDQLLVRKLVSIPDREPGKRPVLNNMAFTGNRLFVGEQIGGKIYELVTTSSGGRTPVLFLDVAAAVQANTGGRALNTHNEAHGGLRGIAFHPEFASNGKFYTALMETRPDSTTGHRYISDVTNPISADGVVVEWTYDFQTRAVNSASYREVCRIGMPMYDHPIKQIDFNRYATPGHEDYGLLYIAHGDGSHQSVSVGGGQNNDALGKILRINPLAHPTGSYSIPPTNPFVNDPAWLDEIYALGFRNPHTFSFEQSSNNTTHLVVGDAGRDNVEEINLVVSGGNYGWPRYEGTFEHLQQGGGVIQGVAPLLSSTPSSTIFPAAQWGHQGTPGVGFVAQATVSGYALLNPIDNRKYYLFADFADAGRIFYSDFEAMVGTTRQGAASSLTQAPVKECRILFDHDNNVHTPARQRYSMHDVFNDETGYPSGSTRTDLRFGQGPNGEVYLLSKTNGWLYEVHSLRTSASPAYAHEAEDAQTNATVARFGQPKHPGHTGSGHVRGVTETGKFVQFDVNVPTTGVYLLDLRYAAGRSDTRTMSLYVNGQRATQVGFAPTNGWSDWQTQTTAVELTAGPNTVTYRVDAGDNGAIDPDVLHVRSSTYEAEDATINEQLSRVWDGHSGYRGSGFVEQLTTTGSHVTFNVPIPRAATYVAEVRYAAGAGTGGPLRTMSVYLNGTKVEQAQFPSTDTWSSWATQSLPLRLVAGTNIIKYQMDATDSGWINLDYLQLRHPLQGRAAQTSELAVLPTEARLAAPYPNPANTYLEISGATTKTATAQLKQPMRADLYNNYGKLVRTATGNTAEAMRLNTAALPEGFYHVVLTQPGQLMQRHNIQVRH